MAEALTKKVRYELSENETRRFMISELEYQGAYPFVVLPPPLGWPRDKVYPRVLQALDAPLVEELFDSEATHSGDIIFDGPNFL